MAKFYGSDELILPLVTLSIIYLIQPFFLVQEALIIRENRLKITAFSKAALAVITNLITALLALLSMGVWAAVLAMLLAYPAQIIINYKNHSWRPTKNFKLDQWQEVVSFGGNILGVSLLEQLRLNLDYLIVGGFIGVDALGLYFFAFNAGIGISQNVIKVFTSSIFPYLCEVNDNLQELKKRFFSSLKKTSIVVIPLILLQSMLAPFYVPIIFGQKWVTAIPILIIICLSALPLSLYHSTNQLLNAVNKTQINLYWNLIFTVIFAMCLLVVVKWGVLAVALSVLACQVLIPIFCIWAIKYVFARRQSC